MKSPGRFLTVSILLWLVVAVPGSAGEWTLIGERTVRFRADRV